MWSWSGNSLRIVESKVCFRMLSCPSNLVHALTHHLIPRILLPSLQIFKLKFCVNFSHKPFFATFCSHLLLLDFIPLTMFCVWRVQIWTSSLFSFCQFSVTWETSQVQINSSLFTFEAQVWSQASQCGVCGRPSWHCNRSYVSTWFFSFQYIFTDASYSHFIYQP